VNCGVLNPEKLKTAYKNQGFHILRIN